MNAIESGWLIDVEAQANGMFALDLTVLEGGVPVLGAGTEVTREELQGICSRLQAALGAGAERLRA